jgi:hypothetical protein
MKRAAASRQRKATPQASLPARAAHGCWLKIVAVALAAMCLVGLFSTEIADTDFWWHLKTGQYIVEHRSLPVPDPFAYTTSLHLSEAVMHFNLTHEWLSQVLLYLVYYVGGFPAVILVRAIVLAVVCGLAGLLSARLSGNLHAGIAAAFATASVASEFTADRPAVVTFIGVAVFMTVLEFRRYLWTLPPLGLIWANCHSGFVLGWIVLLAYCADAFQKFQETAPSGRGSETSSLNRNPRERLRNLILITTISIAVSGLNPNGFGVLSALAAYRRSDLTANLVEWRPPSLWGPPYGFDVLLYAAIVVLAVSWRKVRLPHWILFAAFAAASLVAFRNILLIGFLAPVLIAAYWPLRMPAPGPVAWAAPLLMATGLVAGLVRGAFFQLRVATWTTPASAVSRLAANHVTGRMFNTYEQGGYLIWTLWPQERVFIDGRALSEAVNRDYRQILFNRGSYADQVAGPRAELIERYGIQVVVMNTLDYVSGALYPLALALANPASSEWQLVYEDSQDVIFMRRPPARIPVLANKLGRVLRHLDTECQAYIEQSPDTPLCARTLGDYWLRNGVRDRGRRMFQLYLEHARKRDPEVEQRLR